MRLDSFKIALIGRTNVGKSTLFNRLIRANKALTFNRPGVTRDTKERNIFIFNKKALLIDCPGMFDYAECDNDIVSTINNKLNSIIVQANIIIFVIVIDDYAHHPTEISSVLSAARQCRSGRIIIIHQPHRFKRLNQLFNKFVTCFEEADTVIILPVYKAGDVEFAPLNATDLYKALKNKSKFFANDIKELKQILLEIIEKQNLNKNDLILFTGAGSISQWANDIVTNWQK